MLMDYTGSVVIGGDAHFTVQLELTSKDSNGNVKINQNATEAVWYLGNRRIQPEGRYNMVSVGNIKKLLIRGVKEEDGGQVRGECDGLRRGLG